MPLLYYVLFYHWSSFNYDLSTFKICIVPFSYSSLFNFYLNTFLVELNTIVPEFKEVITKNYSDILANSNSNSDFVGNGYLANSGDGSPNGYAAVSGNSNSKLNNNALSQEGRNFGKGECKIWCSKFLLVRAFESL